MNSKFKQNVLEIVKQIPAGKTLTYGQVAALAGNPKAARAVGMIMSQNYNVQVPCHRVICADGKLGNYNRGGTEKKEQLLHDEKAAVSK
jgi:O-6-methylguanine DNA methyltransferase